MKYDITIIGGGPAGLTAAIYAARGGLSVALVEKQGVGGQAALAVDVENYPGISGVSGFELTLAMEDQAKHFGVDFIYDEVLSLNLTENPKQVVLAGCGDMPKCENNTIFSSSIILCMGASPRRLGLPREKDFIGSGVSYCATCDGAFFRGKTVAIVGGGNTAVQDALYLERFASKIYLIHRRDELRASKILSQRVAEAEKVKMIWNSKIKAIGGENKLAFLDLVNVKSGKESELSVDGLFVAIGQEPNTTLATLEKDESGYIITNEDMSTKIQGVFAAGDLRKKSLRQIITACADGATAAESASLWLVENSSNILA